MKICLVTDTHFGIHKSAKIFLKSQLDFFNNELIPYIKENDIDTVIFGGDTYDTRNSVNVMILNEVYSLFEKLDFLKQVIVIVGNHDTYYKTEIETNSLKMLKKFKNVTVIEDNTIMAFDGVDFLLSPWQIDYAKFIRFCSKNPANVCIGHFDINEAKMNKYKTSDSGFDAKVFANFDIVYSGHFHTRSTMKKHGTDIVYIGSPYALDRNDIDEEKGFCIIDTNDVCSVKYVNNKNSIKYISVNYPNACSEKQIKDNIVDVYVDYNKDYSESDFRNYMEKLNKLGPISVSTRLINNFLTGDEIEELEAHKAMDIEGLMDEYVKGLELKNKDVINSIIVDLYENVLECV